MRRALAHAPILLLLAFSKVSCAFSVASCRSQLPKSCTTSLFASTTASSKVAYEVVTGGPDDPRVTDVATFRNGMVSPQMMVDRAMEKREAVDTTEAALNGLKIGLLYVGLPVAGLTYVESQDAMQALLNYGVVGVGVGALLAGNAVMGRTVHVPSLAEATNRITVDYSEGLLRQQDVGFVACTKDDDPDAAAPSNGVVAAMDGQLRNSPASPSGVRSVSGLPAHLHLKNMAVWDRLRRQGIGQGLLEAIEEYATKETDARALTLEVEKGNTPAVRLYEKFGFVETENPQKMRSFVKFMIKNLK